MRLRPRTTPGPSRTLLRHGGRTTLWLAAVLLLLPASLHAQPSAHFGHQAWSTEDGLPQNSVHQVLQTSDGFIWIATEGGLARFDGITFTVFRHEEEPAFLSDDIACLAQSSDGSLWVGTTDGLLRYQSGRFSEVHLGSAPDQPSVLAIAAADDGTVLVQTATGLTRLVNGQPTPQSSLPGTVQDLAQAPDGTVWLATGTELLQYRSGGVTKRQDLAQSLLGLQVDDHGTVWLRSPLGIRSAGSGIMDITPRDLPPGVINTFLSDMTGRLWIGTTHGLYLKQSTQQIPFRVEELGPGPILSLTQDREGSLWVGTEADGLHILRAQQFDVKSELNDHAITALAQTSDASVWLGTRDDGLRVSRRAADGSFGPATEPKLGGRLASQVILALAAGLHNDLWVGTLDGLDHLQHDHMERFSSADGLPDDVIRSLLVDPDGSLWIGTRRGLVHWSGLPGAAITRVDGLPSDLIGAMLRTSEPSGNLTDSSLWVATLNGLSRLRDGHVTANAEPARRAQPTVITSLAHTPEAGMWVGTRDAGLQAVTPHGLRAIAPPGLPQRINSLVADRLGFLWIGSARGVFRAPAGELSACLIAVLCSPHIAHFGYADGMPTEETSASGHPTAIQTSDGRLWFATSKGVAIVDPSHLRTNPIPPPVVIERFLAGTQDELLNPPPFRLPFGRAGITFDYIGLSFLAPSRVRYRYLLEGFDRQWTEAGARRSAFYTNLPPGHYTFRVQAANNDGVWNHDGASLSFSILPPFYRRPWFYALALLALGALAYAVYYLRVRRLRSEFNAVLAERNRIAREIHDTLAQNFVGISIHLQLAEQLLASTDLDGIRTQLQQTRSLVQEGLNDARQSIWELRASVAQDSLPTRLSRLVERSSPSVAAGAHVVAGEVTITGIYRPLDALLENEVLRIAGEAFTNVTRHSRATRVEASLRYERDRLQLVVVDNGQGFDPDAVASTDDHFGLQGMRERTAALRATLSIVSSPGAGTTVTLIVPFPRAERRTS